MFFSPQRNLALNQIPLTFICTADDRCSLPPRRFIVCSQGNADRLDTCRSLGVGLLTAKNRGEMMVGR